MTAVKLKDIPGVLVEKKAVVLNIEDRRLCCTYAIDLREIRNCELKDEGRKYLITKISNFLDGIANKFTPINEKSHASITLNRERLAHIIGCSSLATMAMAQYHNQSLDQRKINSWYHADLEELADAIIKLQKYLLERGEE